MKALLRLYGVCALFACLPLAWSQTSGPKILRVDIKHVGPAAVSEELIRANLHLKAGDAYLPATADDDVHNLYATGLFYNIRVNAERAGEGLILTYVVQAMPRLTDIKISGNKKLTEAKIMKKLASKVGEPLNEQKLFSDAQAIQEAYQKTGYPGTTVQAVPNIAEESGRGSVTFEIKESPKIKIIRVEFIGAQAFKQGKLRKVIKTRAHWMWSWLTGSGKFKEDQFQEDRERLAEFYREKGFIDFEIKDIKFENPTPTSMIIQFTIYEGRPYKVGAVTFEGTTMFPTNAVSPQASYGKLPRHPADQRTWFEQRQMNHAFPMKEGNTFTAKGLTKDLDAVQDFYGAKGHINVEPGSGNLNVARIANTEKGTMDLHFKVDEGQKSYVEKIEIRGNTKTKDKVIRRELTIAPGEVFNMVAVKRSQARLEGLQYFDKVDARPDATEVPNRKNLIVGVEEKSTGNLSLGAGFSSVDSIVGFVELTQGNFDLFHPPTFTGGGQKFRLRLQIGTERQDYVMSFIEPWFLDRKLALGVELYYRDLDFQSVNDVYSEIRYGTRLSLTRALWSDYLIGSVSYTIENVGIRLQPGYHGPITVLGGGLVGPGGGSGFPVHLPANVPTAILNEVGDSLVSKVGLSIAYDTRNSTLLPDAGQRSEVAVDFAGGPLGGEQSYYKVEAKSAWYFRGFGKGHVLEVAGRLGVADGFNGHDVPFYDRYYLGGLYSLRGFEYRAISPREPGFDEPIGGNTYWFGTAEYSIPIIQKEKVGGVRLAMFYDVGSVEAKSYHFSFENYSDNWGFGLRLNLPIGPLRLDYGIPIHHDNFSSGSGRFEFGVGYTREFSEITRPVKDLSSALAKKLRAALALTSLTFSVCAAAPASVEPTKASAFATLPLYFEAASGQTGGDFPFLARGPACSFFVGPAEAVLVLTELESPARGAHGQRAGPSSGPRRATRELRFQFVDANAAACVDGTEELPGTANYFLGRNPAHWRTSVPLFARVRVGQIYPGVDLVYYGNQQRLEYDFVVAPKADPGRIAIRFTGADKIRVDAEGELVFTLGRAEIRQPKPVVYQTIHGARREIAGSYTLTGRQTVTFQLGEYDRELPLVIDPVLSYATFYGGSGADIAWAVGVDTNGFVYVAGETMGALPTSPATVTNQYHGAGGFKGDAFVAKFNNAASRLIYLSYLGGSADDVGLSLAVDDEGNAYVTGYTDSADFPTQNPIYSQISGKPYPGLNLYPIDAFVAKIGPAGTNLVYSTYLGGDWVDEGVGIAVDPAGSAYVTGYTESTNFPTLTDLTARANYGGVGDAFLAKISPSGTNLVYSLYLGGSDLDVGSGVAANADGLAFVTGYTRSTNFPVFRAFQPASAGGLDAFVTVIGPTGTNPVFSTYLGGSRDNVGFRIALDSASNFYVTGLTTEDANFPITPSALNPGGVFRSENGAADWQASSTGLASVVASALAVDPVTPMKLYAGTGRGVARSEDGGASWNLAIRVNPETNNSAPAIAVGVVLSLALDPATPTTIYAGTVSQGIYKSLDGGTNWSLSNTGLVSQKINALAVDPLTPATIYAGTDGGVFTSTNSATNWIASNSGLGNAFVRSLAVLPMTPATLYAATAGGVFRSTDGGAAWQPFNAGLSSLFVQAIVFDPVTPATLYVGTEAGVFKSLDGGTNWGEINAGLTASNVTALAIDPLAPTNVYAGTTNGLFKSSDGGTNWSSVTNGLTVPHVLALAVNPQAPATLFAGTQGTSFFGGEDVFLFKSGTNGFSAVFGGTRDDEGWDVAVDSAAHAHIVGVTSSTNFPTQNAAGNLSATNAGGSDAFVAELNGDGSALVQSAYFGGLGSDRGYGIALDPVGNTYFVGETSSPNFPTFNPGQSTFAGVKDAFLVKLLGDAVPTLGITSTGSEITLSWPPYWPEFSVQTTTNLADTNAWATLPMAAVQTNGAFNLQLGATNDAGFFRLRRESAGPGF